jgi:DNA repair exonuclease SbcCD ATPase subunit
MAKAIPNPEPQRPAGASGGHEWDDPLARELAGFPGGSHPGVSPASAPAADPLELEGLRAENNELRSIIAELRQLVDEAATKGEETWAERQKEYESLLDEKTETIRVQAEKVQELESRPPPGPATPKEEELLAMSEEIERERCQLQQERRQLEEDRNQLAEDEQTMTQQMREMEVQMAKERADMARQKTELQRIHDEIRHELEKIERNGQLNQRLGQLRQRYQEVSARSGNTGESSGGYQGLPPQGAPSAEQDSKSDSGSKKRDSGLLRRFFGQGGG